MEPAASGDLHRHHGLAQIGKARRVAWWIMTATGSLVVSALKRKRPDARDRADRKRQRATVTAVKMGAVDYLKRTRAPLASGTEKSEHALDVRGLGALGHPAHLRNATQCFEARGSKPPYRTHP